MRTKLSLTAIITVCFYTIILPVANAQIYNPLNPASPAQITPNITTPLPNIYQVPRYPQSNPSMTTPYVFPAAPSQNSYIFNPTLTPPNVLSPVSPAPQPGTSLPNAGTLNPGMRTVNPNIKITNPSLNIPNLTQSQSSSTNTPATGTYNPIPGIQLPQPEIVIPNTLPASPGSTY